MIFKPLYRYYSSSQPWKICVIKTCNTQRMSFLLDDQMNFHKRNEEKRYYFHTQYPKFHSFVAVRKPNRVHIDAMLYPGALASPSSEKEFCQAPPHTALACLYISRPPARKRKLFLFLSSLALFAFWLRSSVVSVLFSLISEMSSTRGNFVITLIFGSLGGVSSALAHDASAHCVPGITLLPGDATFSLLALACPARWRRVIL